MDFKETNYFLKPTMQMQTGQFALFGLLFLLLQFYCNSLAAQEKSDLLILNSDYSITKYALTQQVFEASQNKPSTIINLADQQLDEDEISDLIKLNEFKIIYCIGSKAYLLAHRVAPEKQIVFSSVINWRRLPMTEKSYGIAQELPAGMQLMMYRYLFPKIKKIGVLYSKQFNKEWLSGAIQSAQEMGIEVIGKDVTSDQNLSVALAQLLPKVDALWLIADPMVLSDRTSVIETFQHSAKRKKPIFTYSEIFIDFGALLVISADVPTMGRQASALVDELRNNNTIAERVYNPAGSHIIINLKKLEQYPIFLNKEALGSVNQIIE